jgi:hypothetical protein
MAASSQRLSSRARQGLNSFAAITPVAGHLYGIPGGILEKPHEPISY